MSKIIKKLKSSTMGFTAFEDMNEAQLEAVIVNLAIMARESMFNKDAPDLQKEFTELMLSWPSEFQARVFKRVIDAPHGMDDDGNANQFWVEPADAVLSSLNFAK